MSKIFLSSLIGVFALICFVLSIRGSKDEEPEQDKNPRLVMRLSATDTTLFTGQRPEVKAAITNEGTGMVTLVRPADGSYDGWRTPIVSWSILSADDKAREHDTKAMERVRKSTQCSLVSNELLLTVW